jgi:hypothetical protein
MKSLAICIRLGVDVNNMQVNTIGERVSKYTSIVSVSAEIQTS